LEKEVWWHAVTGSTKAQRAGGRKPPLGPADHSRAFGVQQMYAELSLDYKILKDVVEKKL
jgi:hypothetical protein